jgi:hypothetical protein
MFKVKITADVNYLTFKEPSFKEETWNDNSIGKAAGNGLHLRHLF